MKVSTILQPEAADRVAKTVFNLEPAYQRSGLSANFEVRSLEEDILINLGEHSTSRKLTRENFKLIGKISRILWNMGYDVQFESREDYDSVVLQEALIRNDVEINFGISGNIKLGSKITLAPLRFRILICVFHNGEVLAILRSRTMSLQGKRKIIEHRLVLPSKIALVNVLTSIHGCGYAKPVVSNSEVIRWQWSTV